jgi:nucleotide-binding universal stress UspA family protein
MNTIVLGYDDSPEAGRALERTAELAKALGARVIVASAAPVAVASSRGAGPYDPADPPERHRELAESAATTLAGQGVQAEAASGLGDAADAIAALADERRADLVVVGMSHHSRFFGGVSDDVAGHAGCDVLLVK